MSVNASIGNTKTAVAVERPLTARKNTNPVEKTRNLHQIGAQ